ncbi:MAG: hypothetical protein IPI12_14780 [Ignavibacteriales bacterium]|nr:hypothetical protein [Ignavibacteriales bacterium]
MLSSYYRKLNFVLLKGTRFRVPLFLMFCLMTVTSAQNFTRLGLPNYSVFSSVVTQTEVVAVVHPNDPNSIFASANAISFSPQFFVSEGIYVSSDGGTSFWGTDTCSGGPSIAFHGGDPGITIDKNGTFILTRNGKIRHYGLCSHRPTDQGRTWSNAKAITNIELERAWLAADNSPSSPYYGRVYAAWVRYSPPYPLVFVYTDDGEKTGRQFSRLTHLPTGIMAVDLWSINRGGLCGLGCGHFFFTIYRKIYRICKINEWRHFMVSDRKCIRHKRNPGNFTHQTKYSC